jgi:uncharacterized protein YigE (DUF2233 family)
MLVIDGALHPRFSRMAPQIHSRNGVGDPATAVFAISNVNFHDFGTAVS